MFHGFTVCVVLLRCVNRLTLGIVYRCTAFSLVGADARRPYRRIKMHGVSAVTRTSSFISPATFECARTFGPRPAPVPTSTSSWAARWRRPAAHHTPPVIMWFRRVHSYLYFNSGPPRSQGLYHGALCCFRFIPTARGGLRRYRDNSITIIGPAVAAANPVV